MELQIEQESDEYKEVSLKDLLKAQQKVRTNVNISKDDAAREAAIRRFGLVEAKDGGKSAKQTQSEMDALREENTQLKAQLAALTSTAPTLHVTTATPPAVPIPATDPAAVPTEQPVVVASAKTTGVPAAADPASAKAPKAPAAPVAPTGEVNPFAKS